MVDTIRVVVEVVGRGMIREVNVKKGVKVEEVLRMIGLNPVEYVVILGRTLVPEDEMITQGTRLKLVPVVSGG
ncbi:MAG: thiamine biosynthesis protein ThiS [Thermoprotei archaeon]|nr:MAG: thiamine biosynthesis protein ThiS [Thermoprotei archaeon]